MAWADATGLDARTATSQQVHSELRAREEPMTDWEQAMARELLEDRALMQTCEMSRPSRQAVVYSFQGLGKVLN